jgi:hypothetical protein
MKTSFVDVSLIAGGLILLATGLWRAFPLKISTQFVWNTLPMLVVFVVCVVWIVSIGGTELLGKGMDVTLATSSSFLLTIALLMPLIGFGTIIAKHYEIGIARALTGPFGYPCAIASSFLSPSGNALSGVVVKMWDKRELRPLLLYFLTVVPLVSVTIFYVRQLGLGIEITKMMYRVNWIVAVGLWPCFWIWGKFINRT